MASASGGLAPLRSDYSKDFPDDLTNKRPRTINLDEFITINGQRQKHECKYLLIDNIKDESQFHKISPFFVQKALDMVTSGLKNVKKLRSGQLLVETKYSSQINKLMKTTMLAGTIPISVKLHPHLNSSKGIVYAAQLIDESEENLLAELSDQKVVDVKRIRRLALPSESLLKDAEGFVKTPLLIITFDTTTLPRKLKAGYLNLNVEVYVPNPMRCKNCQKFGHTKKWCKSNATCAKCSLEFNENHPEDIMCANNLNCANCHGSHEAFRKSCKRFKEEYAISKIKTTERITYNEAKIKFSQINVINAMVPVADIIKNQVLQQQPPPTFTTSSSTPKAPFTLKAPSTSKAPTTSNANDVEVSKVIKPHQTRSTTRSTSPYQQKAQNQQAPKIQTCKQDATKKVKAMSPPRLSNEDRDQLIQKLKEKNDELMEINENKQNTNTINQSVQNPSTTELHASSDDSEAYSSSTSKSSIIKNITKNKSKRKLNVKSLTMDIN